MKITIEINDNLIEALERISKGQYKSVEDYCSNYIEKYLLRESKNESIDKIQQSNIEQFMMYKESVNNVHEKIKESQAKESENISSDNVEG